LHFLSVCVCVDNCVKSVAGQDNAMPRRKERQEAQEKDTEKWQICVSEIEKRQNRRPTNALKGLPRRANEHVAL